MKKPVSLVTGAAGFIGSHVAQHLENMGHRVVGVDNLSGGYRANLPAGMDGENRFYWADITDARVMSGIFEKEKPDYVFHLAAYAAEGLSHFIRTFNYTNNVLGSVNLINAAIQHGVEHFVFTSSIAVYGGEMGGPDVHPSPIDPYGAAKLCVEHDLGAAFHQFGLHYSVFRPHNVYGPGQNLADPYRNVVGIFMNQVMQGKPMTIFGDGMQTRQFSYIDDVAPYITRVVDTGFVNETWDIGGATAYTVLELAETVAQAFGVTPDIKFLPARHEALHAHADHSLVEQDLMSPGHVYTDLKTGVKKMAEWAQKVGPRPATPAPCELELEEGLPEIWKKLSKIR